MASPIGRLVLAVTEMRPVRALFTRTRPGRALAMRFVAGETLGDAIEVSRRLNASGASVSLDHLGEHVADPRQAEDARAGYLTALDRIAGEEIDGNISVKLTQLGLGIDDALAAQSLGALAAHAAELGRSVTVDMEESRYTEATVAVFEKVQAEHGNLGLALQSYLRRSEADMQRVLAAGGHLRICKGAYAEPLEVAYQAKSEVDASFDRMTRAAMESPAVVPAIATHDQARITLALDLAESRSHPWEFQMLYGVRTKLQSRLLADGFPLRIYVPYGAAWYPYLTRRIAERPANLWFFLRAVVGR